MQFKAKNKKNSKILILLLHHLSLSFIFQLSSFAAPHIIKMHSIRSEATSRRREKCRVDKPFGISGETGNVESTVGTQQHVRCRLWCALRGVWGNVQR
ncbi:hypothetical protein BZA77DRAFT_326227 [Pyronema omphalodes]|nr:hypothetical protein BZA77DRAFT_326227 [Pyronema omphalodes]